MMKSLNYHHVGSTLRYHKRPLGKGEGGHIHPKILKTSIYFMYILHTLPLKISKILIKFWNFMYIFCVPPHPPLHTLPLFLWRQAFSDVFLLQNNIMSPKNRPFFYFWRQHWIFVAKNILSVTKFFIVAKKMSPKIHFLVVKQQKHS